VGSGLTNAQRHRLFSYTIFFSPLPSYGLALTRNPEACVTSQAGCLMPDRHPGKACKRRLALAAGGTRSEFSSGQAAGFWPPGSPAGWPDPGFALHLQRFWKQADRPALDPRVFWNLPVRCLTRFAGVLSTRWLDQSLTGGRGRTDGAWAFLPTD